MLFSSTVFLFAFLPCTLFLYYLFRRIPRAKNTILLLSSLFFYAWGEPRFVLVMLASIVWNYCFGLLIGLEKKKARARAEKLCLTLGICGNLGLLFVFKYLTFLLGNVKAWFSLSFAVPEIALPIGISFFTFQSMSYLIDVSRGDAEVQKNPLDLALFVSLFPQLIAGPIVRYNTVAAQIKDRRETWDGFTSGMGRFLCGLFKKVLLANNMGLVADKAFSMNAEGSLTAAMAWLGALAYTLQIYYDFSGYSDMAIGLGSMFGFTFEENFNYPYISESVTEFWRRWHISLGTWFRDYVYIPLGGSRVKSRARLIFNLAAVWILTGVWHGAAWNFLLWGVWYLLLLLPEKLLFSDNLKREKKDKHPLSRVLGFSYTMLAVILGWVLFRAENLSAANTYFAAMFGAGTEAVNANTSAALLFLGQKAVYFIAAILFCAPVVPFFREKLEGLRRRDDAAAIVPILCDAAYPVVMGALFLVCVAFLLKSSYNPFIYFNF